MRKLSLAYGANGSTTVVDPTINGTIIGDFGGGSVAIEFDADNDARSTAPSPRPATAFAFTYDPRDDNADLVDFVGAVQVDYRLVHRDTTNTIVTTGDWQSMNFDMIAMPDATFQFKELGLLNDTGADTSDNKTSDPSLYGIVTSANSGSVDGILIEVDLDGDGIADDTTDTDEAGRFEITPSDIDYGQHFFAVRTVEWNATIGALVASGWQSTPVFYTDDVGIEGAMYTYVDEVYTLTSIHETSN